MLKADDLNDGIYSMMFAALKVTDAHSLATYGCLRTFVCAITSKDRVIFAIISSSKHNPFSSFQSGVTL